MRKYNFLKILFPLLKVSSWNIWDSETLKTQILEEFEVSVELLKAVKVSVEVKVVKGVEDLGEIQT